MNEGFIRLFTRASRAVGRPIASRALCLSRPSRLHTLTRTHTNGRGRRHSGRARARPALGAGAPAGALPFKRRERRQKNAQRGALSRNPQTTTQHTHAHTHTPSRPPPRPPSCQRCRLSSRFRPWGAEVRGVGGGDQVLVVRLLRKPPPPAFSFPLRADSRADRAFPGSAWRARPGARRHGHAMVWVPP